MIGNPGACESQCNLGGGRAARLWKAVCSGGSGPPCDLRYLKKAGLVVSEKASNVTSFLSRIYESVAETLPDVRDELGDVTADVQEYNFQLDAYAIALQEQDKKKQARQSDPKAAGFKLRCTVPFNLWPCRSLRERNLRTRRTTGCRSQTVAVVVVVV